MPRRSPPPSRSQCRFGAVLAGGESTRMGSPKPVVELRGRPLITYPLEAVAAAGLEPIVVAKPRTELPPLECRVLRDTAASFHPAAGIVAALEALGDPVVAVACDMPFVAPGLLAHLAATDVPVAVPRIGGRLQPLLGRYEASVASPLKDAIERSAPLGEAIATLDPLIVTEREVGRFGPPERIGLNVNDRDQLALARNLAADLGAGATAPTRAT